MRKLTAEQKLLLELVGCAVHEKQPPILPELINWQLLAQESGSQGVFLPVFHILSRDPSQLPEDIYQEFFQRARRATARNMQVEFAQTELVSALEQGGYPYVILKGEASASYYPMPELRQLGDVDFLVPEDCTDRVIREMEILGYSSQWHDHHWLIQKERNRLEMHIEASGIPKEKGRREITEFLNSIYEECRIAHGSSGDFRVSGDAHHGLILILHMQHHAVCEGIGLRHIMDWACYVNATAGKPFWQERLLPILQQAGLLRFAAVMTKMSGLYFGSYCPDWAANAEEGLCRELMEDILSGGNFGRKNAERSRAGNMLPDWEKNEKEAGKLRLLYRTLRKAVLRKHPGWGRKPVRLFLAMTGKAIRYAALFALGKRPNLLKAAAYADTRRSVYEKLRLFETE